MPTVRAAAITWLTIPVLCLVALLALVGGGAGAGGRGPEVLATHVALEVFQEGAWHEVSLSILVQPEPGRAGESLRAAEDAMAARFPVRVRQPLSNENSNYVLSGYAWPDNAATWGYNPAGSPAGLTGHEAAIRASAPPWGATGANFSYSYSGTTAATTGACSGGSRLDGLNTVGWAPLSGDALAVTCSWFQGSTAIEFDMQIDPDWDWTTGDGNVAMDLRSTVTHEFGHGLGLGHTPDATAVMYATYTRGTIRRVPQCDDILGEIAIYGGTAPPECQQVPTSTPSPTATPTPTASPTATATPIPEPALGTTAAAQLMLHNGANLLTWPGVDTEPAAVYGGSDRLEAIYWWDGEAGRWLRWTKAGPPEANSLVVLTRGNAYWFLVVDQGAEGEPVPVPGT